jgi:hypothetical protein
MTSNPWQGAEVNDVRGKLRWCTGLSHRLGDTPAPAILHACAGFAGVLARGCEIVPSPRSDHHAAYAATAQLGGQAKAERAGATISTGKTSRALPSVLLLIALLLVVLRGDFLLIALAFLWNWM